MKTLIEEEGNPDLKLRVFVSGGGCSGFQYGFTFDEVANEDDTAMQKDGVTLLIDPMSYQYLVGAEIDYQEGLEGAQFVIKNPNAHDDLRLRVELLGLSKSTDHENGPRRGPLFSGTSVARPARPQRLFGSVKSFNADRSRRARAAPSRR